jgi:hypothetical protein
MVIAFGGYKQGCRHIVLEKGGPFMLLEKVLINLGIRTLYFGEIISD